MYSFSFYKVLFRVDREDIFHARASSMRIPYVNGPVKYFWGTVTGMEIEGSRGGGRAMVVALHFFLPLIWTQIR